MIDLSKIAELLRSVETDKEFTSLAELRSQIQQRQLSYEGLLDYAAASAADNELLEFENEALNKILCVVEELHMVAQEISAIKDANHSQFSEIAKLHEMFSTTKRFYEGQLRGGDLQKTLQGRKAANARHSRPGGSRNKAQKIRDLWATGKFSSRDRCAEEECAALGMSFSAARKALRGTPEPT